MEIINFTGEPQRCGEAWLGTGSEHTLDRVCTRPATGGNVAERREFMWGEGRILCLAIHDQLPDRWRKHATISMSWLSEVSKQARRPMGVKGVRLAAQGPFGGSSLLSTFRRREPKEDDRTDEFVGELLRPVDEQADLLPVLGWGNTRT